MELDIRTLAIIQCLMLITQVSVLFIQFKVSRSYKGIGWWVLGSITNALGVILMLFVEVKPLENFARISNPMLVLGLLFLYIGILRFFDKTVNRRKIIWAYSTLLILYYYFMFVIDDTSARTVVVNISLAAISLMISYKLFDKSNKLFLESAIFTATVFCVYAFFLIVRAFLALVLPPMQSYKDQKEYFALVFIVSIIISMLWTFGLIIMINQRLNKENQQEKEKIKKLAKQLEIEKNVAKLNSITDSLTGLANRRHFDEFIRKELDNLKQVKGILSFIMLDVDYFKKFNDTYGHLEGDECLKKIGSLLKAMVNGTKDIVARYGGEEFVIVLIETKEAEARKMAENIRKKVEKLQIPHCSSDIAEHITVSIGIATISTIDLQTPEEALMLADKALYCAKKEGRNRVS
jgi:diguanylate cyclase (GGDEF)-like protein